MNTKSIEEQYVRTIVCCIASLFFLYIHTSSWADADPHAYHRAMMKNSNSFKQSIHSYKLPDLTLLDKKSNKASVIDLFKKDKTVMVNFIFTTCNTICPIMSGTFSQLDKKLAKMGKKVALISITIDPEFDTPKVLNDYAEKFDSSDQWKFYTGSREDIVKLQSAFNAYRGSKMNHVPITLIKNKNSEEWIRIDGFVSAEKLIQQIHPSQYEHTIVGHSLH